MTAASDLDHLRWQKRVVLVFAPDANDARFEQQMRFLKAALPELEERDVQILEILSDTPDAARLRSKLKVTDPPLPLSWSARMAR